MACEATVKCGRQTESQEQRKNMDKAPDTVLGDPTEVKYRNREKIQQASQIVC